jgi:ATP-dependent DNA helicase DinG
LEFARDTELAILQTAKDMQEIVTLTDNLQAAVHALRLSLGIEQRRAPWPLNLPNDLANSVREVKALLQSTEEALKAVAIRSKPLESAWRRSNQLIERFNVLTGDTPENNVHWFETFAQSFTIQITPMIVAEQFRQYLLEKKRAWIFTSATLTVKNSFQLFVETLGLESALKIQLKSPFDYPKQALLYVPRGMPDPKSREYIQSLVAAVLPVLEMTQGRAFLLFTSHKSMTLAAEILPEYVNYPILLQGTAPKKNLLDQFKELPNAILLGTSSFWYGVDVKGDALSCVIIDKLPFAAPEDPILQARIQMLRKQGIDPFYTYQLPQAVLILKQGAGRLIRDATDRGVLMICDPRLVGSRYGDAFLQSLPNMTRTRELTKVREFLTP